MATQKSLIKLKGTLGDLTFFKTKDGFMAKTKSEIDAKRLASDPAFKRTRENNSEFGAATVANKVLRNAFRELTVNVADSKMIGRLTKEMMRVIHADQTSPRGQRNVIDGEAELLAGFEFNDQASLAATLATPFTCEIDRPAGEVKVNIPAFSPAKMISAPKSATHFKLIMAASAVDFEKGTHETVKAVVQEMPLSDAMLADLLLEVSFTPESENPLFVVMGVEFVQQVNGVSYPLSNGAHNALCLVKVSGTR